MNIFEKFFFHFSLSLGPPGMMGPPGLPGDSGTCNHDIKKYD